MVENAPQPITPEGNRWYAPPHWTASSSVPWMKMERSGSIRLVETKALLESVPKRGNCRSNGAKTGQQVYVARSDYLPVKVYRVDRSHWQARIAALNLPPPDPAGVIPDISSVYATRKGGHVRVLLLPFAIRSVYGHI